jgi:hypothetical protein
MTTPQPTTKSTPKWREGRSREARLAALIRLAKTRVAKASAA